jgi:hypothetical protein
MLLLARLLDDSFKVADSEVTVGQAREERNHAQSIPDSGPD